MESNLLERVDLDGLTASRLWAALDRETRILAARAVYAGEHGEERVRYEADQAIADALRFRLPSVRKLPTAKRAEHLSKMVRPNDSLATSLLIALHLTHRRPMLGAFMDHLKIPNDDGLLDPDHEIVSPDRDALRDAVEDLRGRFPRPEVDLYLATLIAMDPETWRLLADVA